MTACISAPATPADLARVMRRAMNEPGLWECLSSNIARVPTLAD